MGMDASARGGKGKAADSSTPITAHDGGISARSIYHLTGCEHLIGQFPRTTGSNLARHPCWRPLKTTCIGVAKAVKTVVLCARWRAWSRGDATTAVVTHAESVGSRLAECL